MEYEGKKHENVKNIQNEIKQKCKEIYNSRNVKKTIKRRDKKAKLLSQKMKKIMKPIAI